jgi:anti-sigma factor RsiW
MTPEDRTMNTPEKISPDDPLLTAYALGEMDAAARAAFERRLAADAAARAWVEEIRATQALLGAALAEEPAPVPARAIDLSAAATVAARKGAEPARASVLRFPQAYFAAAGLAAACFGVYFVVHEVRIAQEAQSQAGLVQHVASTEAASAPLPAPVPPEADAAARLAPSAAARAEQRARAAFQLVAHAPVQADRFFSTVEAASSTFPLRVGRESLRAVREQLRRGARPGRATVQVAEMINAFNYAWPEPAAGEALVILLEETAAPWAPGHRLVRVGVKGAGPAGSVAAREARVRVDFNPARVRAWRLIGFERDEAAVGVQGLGAGELLRAGDTVTALYEILPPEVAPAEDRTLLTLSLDYAAAEAAERRVVTRRLETDGAGFARASADLKFIAAVAAFGLHLRESAQQPQVALEDMASWAAAGAGSDAMRREWVELMRQAEALGL